MLFLSGSLVTNVFAPMCQCFWPILSSKCPSFSHQHRKPNLKWISSLSESDRLEIHLRFVFGQRAPSTMLMTAGVSTPASPPYNIIRAKRCESPIIWNLLSVILLRDESERVRTESERSQKKSYWFVETYRANGFGPSPRRVRTESERVRNPRFLYKKIVLLTKLFIHSAINTESQISSEFLACQSLTG